MLFSSGLFYKYLTRMCIRKKGREEYMLLRYIEILPQVNKLSQSTVKCRLQRRLASGFYLTPPLLKILRGILAVLQKFLCTVLW